MAPTEAQLRFIGFIKDMLYYKGNRHVGLRNLVRDKAYIDKWLNKNKLNYRGRTAESASVYIGMYKDEANSIKEIFNIDLRIENQMNTTQNMAIHNVMHRAAFEPVHKFNGREYVTHFDENDNCERTMKGVYCADDM